MLLIIVARITFTTILGTVVRSIAMVLAIAMATARVMVVVMVMVMLLLPPQLLLLMIMIMMTTMIMMMMMMMMTMIMIMMMMMMMIMMVVMVMIGFFYCRTVKILAILLITFLLRISMTGKTIAVFCAVRVEVDLAAIVGCIVGVKYLLSLLLLSL